MVINIQNANIC